MKNDETPGKDPEEISIGTFHYDDGNTEIIKAKDFLAYLRRAGSINFSKEPGANDRETFKKLVQILGEILNADVNHPEVFEDVNNREELKTHFRNTLQAISAYLDKYDLENVSQIGEQTREFLEGRRDLMTVARPMGIEDFLKIKDSGAEVVRQFENSTITFTGRLGMNEHKVAEVIRMRFTEMNPYRAKTNIKTLIDVPLTALMEGTGRTVTPNNKKAFVRKLTREILPTIAHAHITLKTETKDGIELKHMEVGGGYFEVSTKSDRILFRISPEYAAYLNTNSLSHYHRKTLLLGDSKSGDELPYYLCIKLQDHYFKDKNKSRGVNMILSIKSVLKFCEDNILCDYIMETDPTHWKRKIKARLEKALDEIQERGIFKWQYCGPGLKEITQAEIDAADFYRWSEKLYITFQFIPEEPDESERLQNKRERIEAAKERKALEDDKITVEADKIRKRRRRKSATKEKKG